MSVIVAIDGPAGAGKSSIARRVAHRLNMLRVDTGAIYRAVTLLCLEQELDDEAAIAELLTQVDLNFEGDRVFIGEREVTRDIRQPEVTSAVSRISAMPALRAGLLGLQRRLGENHPVGAVLEGRDIGTVVFPEAQVKIFLTASPEERARRRFKEMAESGIRCKLDEVLEEIQRRDAYDSAREAAPLVQPEDAVVVDSTEQSFEQVVDEIVSLVRNRLRPPSNIVPPQR